MLADAEAALDWLTGTREATNGPRRCPLTLDASRVFIEGHSLGTCAAHLLGAARLDLGAVVVVQPLALAWRVATYTAVNVPGWLKSEIPVPQHLISTTIFRSSRVKFPGKCLECFLYFPPSPRDLPSPGHHPTWRSL